ncbi:MAG: hypothetical protein K8R59_10825, partial [Thermoanaerobaculales bacterium]|nr:hypothetical protein [Thermoanaerobaculales bacterium]
LTQDAADTDDLGMRLSANPGASYSIERRVDLNKGETYRFGGSLRGTGVGSVVLSLQPVEWQNDELVLVGRSFLSEPLTGSFDWTPTESAAPLTSNHDFVMLRIRVEDGGTVDIDNIFVESTEASTMAFPAAVTETMMIGALIHVEDVAALTWDSDYFRAKIQVLDDLAEVFHRHQAVLTIQPEVEILEGLNVLEPNFIRHLRTDYGCAFSVHTHGPKGPNPSIEEVLAYVRERKETLENMGAGHVDDLNGNFTAPDYSVFSSIGITSMTAFKNTTTQAGYDGRYFHPWRPSPGNPYTDEAAWAIDNPASRVVYVPGENTGITRYSDQLAMKALPGLSAALWNTDPEKPTTWYFVTHVDFFASKDGLSIAEYMQSATYSQDLAAYENLLSEVMDPLVQRDFIEWASPSRMRRAFEEYAGVRPEPGGPRNPTGRVSP